MDIRDALTKIGHWISGPDTKPPAGPHRIVYSREGDGRMEVLVSRQSRADAAFRHVQQAFARIGTFFSSVGGAIARLFSDIRQASKGPAMPGAEAIAEAPPSCAKESVRDSVAFVGRPADLVDVSSSAPEPEVTTPAAEVLVEQTAQPELPSTDLHHSGDAAAPKSERARMPGAARKAFKGIRRKIARTAVQQLPKAAAKAKAPTAAKINDEARSPAPVPSSSQTTDMAAAALALELNGEPIKKKGKIKKLGQQMKAGLRKAKKSAEKKTAKAAHKVKKSAVRAAGKATLKSLKILGSRRRNASDS